LTLLANKKNIKNPMAAINKNHNTVLTVTGLHFKRSKWPWLRKQLKPANQVQNFALSYKPKGFVPKEEVRKIVYQSKYRKLQKQIIKEVLGNTAFFAGEVLYFKFYKFFA